MGVDTAERQTIRAHEWRQFELSYASPEYDTPESLAPYRSAMELIDYAAIEQRAMTLLEAHEASPKPELRQEYEDNARTALFEALTASGHLSRVELHGTLQEVNEQILNRLLNGYGYDLPDHELKRRFKEICEELVVQDVHLQIATGLLPPDTEVGTESAYVMGMSDEAARKIGYRSYNRKGMTRSTGLIVHDDGTITRTIDQISYSNSSADQSIRRLRSEGVEVNREHESDIDLLGHQLIYSRTDMAEGVIGLQRRIDAFTGLGVRFGEKPDDTTPTYESLREKSTQREALVGRFITQLAGKEKELDTLLWTGRIDRREWTKQYMQEVRSIVRTICVLQPEYTKDALGEAVVEDYRVANEMFRHGDSGGAADAVSGASSREQSIVICGNETTSNANQAQESAENVKDMLETAKENWKWVEGRCIVANCPTGSQKKTKVGPCSVCEKCQLMYDSGFDPANIYKKLNEDSEERIHNEQTEEKSDTKKRDIEGFQYAGLKYTVGGAEELFVHETSGVVGTKQDFGLAA